MNFFLGLLVLNELNLSLVSYSIELAVAQSVTLYHENYYFSHGLGFTSRLWPFSKKMCLNFSARLLRAKMARLRRRSLPSLPFLKSVASFSFYAVNFCFRSCDGGRRLSLREEEPALAEGRPPLREEVCCLPSMLFQAF